MGSSLPTKVRPPLTIPRESPFITSVAHYGWLDGDDSHRSAMLEVVKLFEDASTVDELGIGSVRDTFSNTFFPGTSTLHTRARYLLFIPWLVNDVARHRWSTDRAQAELRRRETDLIHALITGEEVQGVIGRDAKSALKTMPSSLYWASLEILGIRRWRTTISGYFRNAAQRSSAVDDPDADQSGVDHLGMAHLPSPPESLTTSVTFELTRDEAEFLKARIASSHRDSAFGWLAVHHPSSSAGRLWEHEAHDEFPAHLRDLVDEARRFHHTGTGPAILYNLILAELTDNDELVEQFSEDLDAWTDELEEHEIFSGWDRQLFWKRLTTLNPRIRPATQAFLNDWWQLAATGAHTTAAARDLVQRRELNLKRARARITYADARSTWGVGAGTGALDFRWTIARSHLSDIAAGLES
jgi:hypothetical protein